MQVELLSIEGSVVTIEAEADLTLDATAAGWAVVPSLSRAHPFTVHPRGHSAVIERAILDSFEDLNVLSTDGFSLKEGELRVAEVEVPTATNGTRRITVGAWEGQSGCLMTSFVGSERDRLVEAFDTLQFSEGRRGLAIDSPVTARPREPEIVKEVPGVGVLSIRPAIGAVLDRVPRARGHLVEHGELFRIRASSDAIAHIGRSAVVEIAPLPDVDTREMLAVAEGLRVEWTPRA
jgi:hypothetical protein